MANLSITAGNVLASATAERKRGTAGATVTAGQALYFDSATGKLKLADNDASAATADCVGIALHGAADGQPLEYVVADNDFTPGGTLVSGTLYVLSATAGAIAPAADLTTTNVAVFLFVAKSTSKAVLRIAKGGAIS